jgi:2'-5' RNA ligase
MSLRLFAALTIPPAVAERVTAVQKGVPGAIWRPPENLHVTLRFFGETPEPVAEELDLALEEIAARTHPFMLRLKGAGVFGRDEPHTLWIGLEPSDPLRTLALDCERAARRAGLQPEPRKFAAHLTIARLRDADRARLISFEQRFSLFQSAPWEVQSLALYSSRVRRGAASLYRVEAEYALS